MFGDPLISAKTAALAYLARNWSIIPLHPEEQRPLLPWSEFQHRLATATEVEDWFRHWPEASVGIVTGALSELVVLAMDLQHGGIESLATLELDHGPLPATLESITGDGVRHLYFSHPGGFMPNKVGLDQGIDVRCDGGYVVAPPSQHSSGRHCHWVPGHGLDDLKVAELPVWLRRHLGADAGKLGHPISHWQQLVRESVDEGERSNAIAALTGHLLSHGVDEAVVLDLMLCWNRVRCHPPLSPDEVASTVASISRLHLRHEGQVPREND